MLSIQAGRPPPIAVKDIFEFRSTRNGTKVVTKEMANFSAIQSHFKNHNFPYFTFYPKSQKTIKVVIRHLPLNIPEEDTMGWRTLDFTLQASIKCQPTVGHLQKEYPL
jgi:hypothetical protein